ncbi:MAG TPA: hypothetical protein VF581_02845 [Flavobacterium sp.]|jgi:hypothetical protein
MKNLYLTLVALLCVNFAVGQSQNITDYSYKITTAAKAAPTDKHQQITASRFIPDLNGTLNVTGYAANGTVIISSITVETSAKSSSIKIAASEKCIGGYDNCSQNCDGTQGQVDLLICKAYCMLTCN